MPNAWSVTLADGRFKAYYTADQAATSSIILETMNKFVDKNILIQSVVPAGALSAGNGSAAISVQNADILGASAASAPTQGPYVQITGSGIVSVGTGGWIAQNTSKSSNEKKVYYPVKIATYGLSNNAAVSTTVAISQSNVTLSDTNNGIAVEASSTGTLSGSITASVTSSGYSASGTIVTATLSGSKTATLTKYITGVTVPGTTTFTVTAKSKTEGTIKVAAYDTSASGGVINTATIVTNGVWTTTSIKPTSAAQGPYYGKTSIQAVSQSNLSAANIKVGTTITVKGGDTNIYSVAGTFSATNTVSSGQTAAAAGQILNGYSAWVQGVEVKGNITNRGNLNKTITTQTGTITVTAGYYTGGTVTAQLPTTTVTSNAWSKNATSKLISTTYANWNAGYISNTGNIPAVTFRNTPDSNVSSYIDLTDALTSTANGGTYYLPEVTSSRYIYISRGYIDNVSIDIGRFIPDISSSAAVADHMLQGYSAYDGAGNLITGTIASLAATTYSTSSSDQTIASGKYIAGTQTIKAVSTTGIDAGNIKYNVVVKVGDANDTGRIKNVTGTFTQTPSGKTALAAGALRSGYAGFINGTQVNGNMPDTTASTTFTATNIGTYFSTTTTTGSISIVPKYSVTTAGYIPVTNNSAGTTLYYNIKTASLAASAGNVTLQSDSTSASGTNPFSIYATSNTRNIAIVTANTVAVMGSNKVYIKVQGIGSVAASTTGWLTSTAAVSSTTADRYVSIDYYTGTYTIP